MFGFAEINCLVVSVTASIAIGLYPLLAIYDLQNEFISVVDRNVSLLSIIFDLRFYAATCCRFALDDDLTNDVNEHQKMYEAHDFLSCYFVIRRNIENFQQQILTMPNQLVSCFKLS